MDDSRNMYNECYDRYINMRTIVARMGARDLIFEDGSQQEAPWGKVCDVSA